MTVLQETERVTNRIHISHSVESCGSTQGVQDLPRVDLSEPQHIVASLLRRACQDYGFFWVEEHGVPASTISRAFQETKKLFGLSMEQKLQFKAAPYTTRGYTVLGNQKYNHSEQRTGDQKEGFSMGLDRDESQGMRGRNRFPPKDLLPDVKPVMEAYFASILDLSLRILKFVAVSLGLPDDFFVDKFTDPLCNVKAIHYPAVRSVPEEGIFAAGTHTDWGCITIMATNDVPGLQIQLSDGSWHSVPPRPGALLVNIGDMLERWSNGVLRSAPHRVVMEGDRDRHCLVFYNNPNFNTPVGVIDTDVTCASSRPVGSKKVIVAGEYLLGKSRLHGD